MSASVVEGAWGKVKTYIFNGYSYRREKVRNSAKYYICSKVECRGRAVCRSDVWRETKSHSHDRDMTIRDRLDALATMKKRVTEDTTKTVRAVFDEVTISDEYVNAATDIAFGDVESGLRKRKRSIMPNIPQSVAEYATLLQQYPSFSTTSSDGQPFFRQYIDGESQAVVFLSSRAADALRQTSRIYVDATFKVTPRPFMQFLTIHAEVKKDEDSRVFPAAYVLMKKRTQTAYEEVIRALKDIVGEEFTPTNVMCDFEAPLQAAFVAMFPGLEVSGCSFHYAQAVLRFIKKISALTQLMQDDEEARKCFSMLLALPLVPSRRIQEGVNIIADRLNSIPDLRQDTKDAIGRFFTYFRRFWIERVGTDKLTVYDQPRRTNNVCESTTAF